MGESLPSLGAEEQARLEVARDWVKGHFTEAADNKYEPLEGKLRVVEAILDNDWVRPDETWKLQALGVALGDAMAQQLLLEWVTVEDEYGRDPALQWSGNSIHSYPLTMISKRVEDGERVDVRELFEQACARLSELAFSGDYT